MTTMKRYFAVLWPGRRTFEAVMLAGYEREGKLIERNGRIGFALDYYPDEKFSYRRELGKLIIGDFGTRQEAEAAVSAALAR